MNMKKGAIARIIIWSFTGLLLVAILIVGILWGSMGKSIDLDNMDFSIGISGERYDNAENYSIGNGVVSDKIDRVEINWLSGEINVEAYEGNNVEFNETQVEDEDDQMRYLVENGKLTIQYRKSGWVIGFSKTPKKVLTLRIPITMLEGFRTLDIDSTSAKIAVKGITALDTIDINNISGAVSLEDINTVNLDIDNVSGIIKAEKLKADSLEFATVSGDINITGEITEIETDSTSGKVTLNTTICPKKIETDSVSGDVILYLPENSGFSAEFDTVSGDFQCELPVVTARGDKRICGDGSALFELDSTSGDIFIKKLITE